jgi:nicotinamidase-related amidase
MPLSTLDERVALIVIDLQKGIVSRSTVHPVAEIVRNAAALAAAFRRHGLPVVLVNVAGAAPGRTQTPRPSVALPPDWTELVPELDAQPSDLLVTKQRWGAFTGTSLDASLRERGVTQVVVTGVATSIGVESTARSASELGYHVVVVTDATTDLDPDTHHNSVTRIFPRLGETATTADVLETLETR